MSRRGSTTYTPKASSLEVRERMVRQLQKDTQPELAVRRAVHARGLRYRLNAIPFRGLRSRADMVFPRQQVAVFVDGCFWHGCPEHGTWPKANASWWKEKIQANIARDERVTLQLEFAGWTVIRVWEHEDPEAAAERIEAVVRSRDDRSNDGE